MKMLFVMSRYGSANDPWFVVVVDGRELSDEEWQREIPAAQMEVKNVSAHHFSNRSTRDNNQDFSLFVVEGLKKLELKSRIVDPHSDREWTKYEAIYHQTLMSVLYTSLPQKCAWVVFYFLTK